ncbi:MAG: ATP-dependent DNA ligase [Betaproteobacteria bacterium]|nr:ATP-dependent DNA ligase [Betaproteobacteria bacterium]
MALFAELVATSREVAATSSRLAKIRALAAFLRTLAPDEIPIAIAFLSGETRQGRLGIAYAALRDLEPGSAPSEPALTLPDVDAAFAELASASGKGSATTRAQSLSALFARATAPERDFLARLVVGELRQGALKGIMADAVAAAADLPAASVRRAAMFAGGMQEVAHVALTEGAAGLERFSIRLMRPVLPMLSQPAQDTDEALQRLGTAAFEWKLDGARVQAHKSGSEVRIYTRNLNDVTDRVPEIVEAVRGLHAAALILDGEAIALKADGTPHAFQTTMRRFGRRLEVEAMRRGVPLSVYFFDCLLCDADVLMDHAAAGRFEALQRALPEDLIVPRIVTSDREQAARFFDDALAHRHEGVMAKALDQPYEAGRPGAGWLKIKRPNTLDLVVLAAEWGNGRRQGWLSNLHLGARDPQHGGFVMLGKTFKGLTDEMLAWQTREFLSREASRDAYTVYVRPEIVVEVAFNEIQESSQYPGGLALRFARVKTYRPDKRADEADTIQTVRRIHAGQAGEVSDRGT